MNYNIFGNENNFHVDKIQLILWLALHGIHEFHINSAISHKLVYLDNFSNNIHET